MRIADAPEVTATLVEEAAAPPKARCVGRVRETVAARLEPLIAR